MSHGEKVLAKRELTEARSWAPSGYGRAEVYVTTAEAQEKTVSGIQVVGRGTIELRFYAKLTLNGEYLVRQTMSRKEVAHLFFSQYQDCSLQELFEIYKDTVDASRIVAWNQGQRLALGLDYLLDESG